MITRSNSLDNHFHNSYIVSQNKNQTPGIGNMPVIGNLFKGKSNSDNLDELLVFIAPRIL